MVDQNWIQQPTQNEPTRYQSTDLFYVKLYMSCPYTVCSECTEKDKPNYWFWKDNGNPTLLDFNGYLFDANRSDVRVHLFSATYICNNKRNSNKASPGKIVQVLGCIMQYCEQLLLLDSSNEKAKKSMQFYKHLTKQLQIEQINRHSKEDEEENLLQ